MMITLSPTRYYLPSDLFISSKSVSKLSTVIFICGVLVFELFVGTGMLLDDITILLSISMQNERGFLEFRAGEASGSGTILEIEGNELGARRNGKGHGFLWAILLSKFLLMSGDKPKNWVVEGSPERCRGRYPTEDSFVPKGEKNHLLLISWELMLHYLVDIGKNSWIKSKWRLTWIRIISNKKVSRSRHGSKMCRDIISRSSCHWKSRGIRASM